MFSFYSQQNYSLKALRTLQGLFFFFNKNRIVTRSLNEEIIYINIFHKLSW